MDYARSLLRNKDYDTDEEKSIIDKWLDYKSNKKPDLDTYLEDYYKMVWPDLIKDICIKRDTMTSPLVTFEEYAFFKGFEWKTNKAHGVKTFTNFVKDNQNERDSRLGSELVEFIELATSPCNMIPVPRYFNVGRSGPYAKWDYWDLTLIQIKKWLDLYEGWHEFIEAMYLDSCVDKENGWEPILFWDTHSHELPLPTDTVYGKGAEEEQNKQIEKNFEQFFERVNKMLRDRAKLLFKKFGENAGGGTGELADSSL